VTSLIKVDRHAPLKALALSEGITAYDRLLAEMVKDVGMTYSYAHIASVAEDQASKDTIMLSDNPILYRKKCDHGFD
jgi:hypothetical protein